MLCFDPQHNGTKEWQRNKRFGMSSCALSVGKITTQNEKISTQDVCSGLKKARNFMKTKKNKKAICN